MNRTVARTVVVGCARGIGVGVAERLARESWAGPLLLADVDADGAERVASEVVAGGGAATACQVDLGDPDSIEKLADRAAGARHLALVAGIVSEVGSLQIAADEFERVFRINTIGPYLAAQAFARTMMEAGGGSIVAIGSIATRFPRKNMPAYSASKVALVSALRVLAMETVPNGVRINFVSPGATDTPMGRAWNEQHPEVDRAAGDIKMNRLAPLDRRIGRPEDIAAAVAFFLGPDSEHVALRELLVDGGESLGL